MINTFGELFKKKKVIIGMVHLLPTPGYSEFKGQRETLDYAFRDVQALVQGGIDAILVENDNDQPHHITVDQETISFMTLIVAEIVKVSSIPIGVEVLLNDPKASLTIARAAGCKFIRTDYFVDRMSRPEYGGEMYINPREILDYRDSINAQDIEILTDLQVKHATLLEKGKSIQASCEQAITNGSDGVIVTGQFTGIQPNLKDLEETKIASLTKPVLVGSGFSLENAGALLKYADGAIVGSSIKEDGFKSHVSERRVRELMDVVNG